MSILGKRARDATQGTLPRLTQSQTIPRDRKWRTCTNCRRRKLRCDRANTCGNCSNQGLECIYMPDDLDHDGRQQLERLKQEHRALEEDFARRLARPSDGKGVEKDRGNAIERGRAEASVASSDGTLEERGTQTSLNGGDRYLVKKQSDRTTVVENTKRVTGRGEWQQITAWVSAKSRDGHWWFKCSFNGNMVSNWRDCQWTV